jgi:hypothetical protein
MSENQPSPEMQEMLGKATHKVVGLYMGDQLSAMLGTQGEDQRDEAWQGVAQEQSAFGEQIRGLRERMKVVAETKKAYPPQIASVTRLPFMGVADQMAREFLGDVLFSRMTASRGYMDYDLSPAEEAQGMASEMGLQEGWRSEQAKGVTLEKSVGKVLQGGLRVAHQPRPRE